jgi:hypothetical protein
MLCERNLFSVPRIEMGFISDRNWTTVFFEGTVYCLAQGFSGHSNIPVNQQRALPFPVTCMYISSDGNKFIADRSKDVYS